MRQVVLTEPGKIEVREVPAPVAEGLGAHDILLKVQHIGICGSEGHEWFDVHRRGAAWLRLNTAENRQNDFFWQ